MTGRSVLALSFLLGWLAPLGAAAADGTPPYPARLGYVTDEAGLLDPPRQEALESALAREEQRSGITIAVVTLDSWRARAPADCDSIESYARGLFNSWGIGSMPANRGALLLVTVSEREARIELGAGYGRDAEIAAERIMQGTAVPSFRRGDYAGGIEATVRTLGRALETCSRGGAPDARPGTPYPVPHRRAGPSRTAIPPAPGLSWEGQAVLLLLIALIGTIVSLRIVYGGTAQRDWRKRGLYLDPTYDHGWDRFFHRHFGGSNSFRSSGSGSVFTGSSSFGGGFSRGGGATGRW